MRKQFTDFIKNNTAFEYNARIPHIEDLIFSLPLYKVNDFIKNINDSYKTLKCDGSPACVIGVLNNRFFVSTKSFFNKTPIINYTIDDIHQNHKKEVAKKLSVLYEMYNGKITSGIFGCDLLFTEDNKQYDIINDNKGIRFKANIINYFIPTYNNFYEKINRAKIGVVFHTKYIQSGNTFKAIYKFDDELPILDDVFSFNNKFNEKFEDVKLLLDERNIPLIEPSLATQICSVINFAIANDINFYDNFTIALKKENIKRKTKYNELNNFIKTPDFYHLLSLHKDIADYKMKLLKSYKFPMMMYINKKDKFIELKNGEGFVLVYKNIIAKVIDRNEFSKYNFTLEKDWETIN